jgi:hypothetical protein
MDLRRVRRLSWVLVASELRSGRGTADPRSLFGQPLFLLVIDAFAVGGLAVAGSLFLRAAAPTMPGLVSAGVSQVLPLLPLFCLGGVVLAGLLFELNRSVRFSTSDAANWLPITPREYVLASSSAIAYSDSLIVALAAGVALAIGAGSGAWPAAILAILLSVECLLAGALVVEMVRATTQRAAVALSGRSGRAALAGRLALFVLVIIVFEVFFSPLLLYRLLGAITFLGPAAYAIPVLWASLSVEAWVSGQFLGALLFFGLSLGLTGVFVFGAAALRVRFWAPSPPEVRMEVHEYSETHPFLARLGLDPVESALVAKDLRGMFRRREMLPVIAIPAVLLVVIAITGATSGATGGVSFLAIYAGWLCGFAAFWMATTSFGQERRALQTLYQLPVTPMAIYRAKRALPVFFGVGYAAVLTAAIAVLEPSVPPFVLGGLFVSYIAAGVLSALLGLAFAARFSDFQERPRPQFIRPWAMLLAMMLAVPLNFAILGVAVLILASVVAGAGVPIALTFGLVGFVLGAAVLFGYLARSGTLTLLKELPV